MTSDSFLPGPRRAECPSTCQRLLPSCNGKSQNKPLCPLRLNDEPVPHKSSKRHLGVVLLESLRWDDHVSHMLKSVRAPLALCKTSAYRYRLPAMTIKHNRLEYCSAVWGGCTRRLQACLERVQLEDARATVRTPHSNPQTLLAHANFPSLGWRRRTH